MTWKILLVLLFLAWVGSGRIFETTVKFSQLKEHDGWLFLEKFKFAAGVAKFNTQFFIRGKGKSKSHQLYVQGIPSEKWEKEQELKCKSSITMPVIIQNLRMTGQKATNMFQFSVSKEDTYYFVIKDCMQMYRKDYDNDNLFLHVKFHAFSNDIELDDAPDQINPEQPEELIQEEAEEESTTEEPAAADSSVNAVPGTEEAPVVPRRGEEAEEAELGAAEQAKITEQL